MGHSQTFPEFLIDLVILVAARFGRAIMPLAHVFIMRSHLIAMRVLLWRTMLVDLGLRSVRFPSPSSPFIPGRVIALRRIVTSGSLFRRSTACALTGGWWRRAWVFEIGGRVGALI